MYENAAYAGNMMRSEQLKDVMVSEAAARHGLPHQVIQELVRQSGGLPQELQGTGAAAQVLDMNAAQRLALLVDMSKAHRAVVLRAATAISETRMDGASGGRPDEIVGDRSPNKRNSTL